MFGKKIEQSDHGLIFCLITLSHDIEPYTFVQIKRKLAMASHFNATAHHTFFLEIECVCLST